MREIVLDTETTGLDPYQGHRMVEIGCVELVNRIPSGQVFHRYLNPERDVPAEAFAVHGLSAEFLKDKPFFAEVADDLVTFIGDAPLIAHNAGFDFGFINAELERCAKVALGRERIVDTLMLARRRHPGGPNSLDALCTRYGIDNSRRTKHGALLDAEILAEVYLELIGGRQASLVLVESGRAAESTRGGRVVIKPRTVALLPRLSASEREAHAQFIASLGDKAIWLDYRPRESTPRAESPDQRSAAS
jgi:DNA polymerase-3 subunit epsilon